jgi:DNA-binding MarR family transcriptional regulator
MNAPAETRAFPLSPEIQEMRAARVRKLIHERNRRAEHFRVGMFSDPAWDLLLELYAFELSQQRTSVTQLGIMSHVPPTTVSRWITALECEGLVERTIDHLDSRRVFVALTRKGDFAMDGYFRGGPGEVT